MRMLMIAAALLMTGCASAVYDSLDRRGVDSVDVLKERAGTLRAELRDAETSMIKAADALAAVDGLDGAALARRLDLARSEGQSAALAAQDMRLAADSMKAASERYFADKERELSLMKPDDAAYRASADRLAASGVAYRAFLTATDAASLRLSPALSLYDAEVVALRKAPTSGAAVAARASSRASTVTAAREAAQSLNAAGAEGDRFLAALN